MSQVKVKWGKELVELMVNLQGTVRELKEELYRVTNVPVERQKIMGLKPTALGDGATLVDVGVTPGKTLMLLGSAVDVVKDATSTLATATIAEAVSGTHAKNTAALVTEKAPNGLKNMANTCYMNAAVQMLRLVPEIREVLESRRSNPLLHALGELYKTLDATQEPGIPLLFWNALIAQCPTFGELNERGQPMQHDAQEALNAVLQCINEGSSGTQRRLFSGMLEQKMTCKEDPEDTLNIRDVPLVMLSCNINTEVQMLEAGLEAAFNEAVTLHSERLSRETLYSRTSRISALPEYLFVHLVRFSWRADTQKKAKILKPVTFPLVLDVYTLCSDDLKAVLQPERAKIGERRDKELERRREARQKTHVEDLAHEEEVVEPSPEIIGNTCGYYELCGVISHKGRSADSGHYVFWGKQADQWLVFDDENVAPVKEEDVRRLRGVGEAHIAYVLMYRSRDPKTRKTVLPI